MILNKLIISSSKCNPKYKTYFSFSFHLRTAKAESNTFYKYEYEYTLCVLYKTQRGFCK